ncbi:indigoidine synthase A-like protein [Obelidium mucronatum]|nr:indigoidine synthase A-like protein [Obelidium mucronatum]
MKRGLLSPIFKVAPAVAKTLREGGPVVALESTIITHGGMGYPLNVETAHDVERIVAATGATPATIALLDGRVCVGLSADELAGVGQAAGAQKASRRDLGVLLAQRTAVGATTVAATALLAHGAGIGVFATGGLGGVHRDYAASLDASADLAELARTPVAVVCAGVKAILDIARTLERLESLGVPVVTYAADAFPAFYTPASRFAGSARLDSPLACARMIWTQRELGLMNGSVIACPIPKESVEIDGDELDKAIELALKEADELGVKGKEVTPFLLKRVREVTEGKSLRANVALIKNNAHIAGQIAVELAKLNKDSVPSYLGCFPPLSRHSKTLSPASSNASNLEKTTTTTTTTRTSEAANDTATQNESNKIVIFGATNLDITAKFNNSESVGKSSSGTVRFSLGGVGRNIAEACYRTGGNLYFVSAIANDTAGQILLSKMRDKCLPLSGIKVLEPNAQTSTAFYNGVLSSTGDVITGVADMTIHALVGTLDDHHQVENNDNTITNTNNAAIQAILSSQRPSIIAFDSNIDETVFLECITYACKHNVKCLYEPTSVPKSIKLFSVLDHGIPLSHLSQAITYITPNALELDSMYTHLFITRRRQPSQGILKDSIPPSPLLSTTSSINDLLWETRNVVHKAVAVSRVFKTVIVKLGKDGVLVVARRSLDGTPADVKKNKSSSYRKQDIQDCLASHQNVKGWEMRDDEEETVVVVHLGSLASGTEKEGAAGAIVSVTGAGDSLVGAFLTRIAAAPKIMSHRNSESVAMIGELVEAVNAGLAAAKLSLETEDAVSEKLTPFVK